MDKITNWFNWVVQAVLIIIFVIYLLHKYVSRNFDYWEKRNVPFLKPKPFVGNFLEIFLQKRDIGHFFADLYNQCNSPYFGIFIFSKPFLIVKDPEILKHILVKDFDNFVDRNILASKYEPATAHMLFSAKGEDWKIMRNKVSPVFSTNKLKSMFNAIDRIALSMQEYIARNSHLKSLEAKDMCCMYSTDVIAKCAFAINAHSFDNPDGEFRRTSRTIFDFRFITSVRLLTFFFQHSIAKIFRLTLFDPVVTNFLRKVFWESIRMREEMNSEGNDLLDIIVNLRKDKQFCTIMKFDGHKVIAQAIMFFAAGFETVATTISFALYELCLNPELQNKLKKDIKDTIKKYNGQLTYESVADIDYLSMVIKETLRKYPALPFLDRVCKSNYRIPGTDLILEGGLSVIVPMVGLHHDPQFYADPDKFIPERFEEDKKDFSFMPFGKGPRMCIGDRFGLLGTKLALVRILNNFELEKSEDTPVSLTFEPRSLLLASTVGLPIKFKKSSSPLF